MLTRQFWLAMFVIVLNEITNGFVLERKSPCNKCQSIAAFYDPYEGSSSTGRDASDHNRARMDLRIFLTQRSIQSFVFVLNQCHEEHTVRWLEVRNRHSDSIEVAYDSVTLHAPFSCSYEHCTHVILSETVAEQIEFQED